MQICVPECFHYFMKIFGSFIFAHKIKISLFSQIILLPYIELKDKFLKKYMLLYVAFIEQYTIGNIRSR
jgi:hypothetical protein